MTVKISNSGHDERGLFRGGKAGDQSGTEWYIRFNYNRPWYRVLRLKDRAQANLMAALAVEAAENDLIGYDQNERTTLWLYLREVGYHPKNIKTKCESDCSAGVMTLLKCVGYLLGVKSLKNLPITSTHYMRSILLATGLFEEYTSSDYTDPDSPYLRKGDILLKDDAHTATVVTNGNRAYQPPAEPASSDIYQVTCSVLNVRDKASTVKGEVVGSVKRGSKLYLTKVKKNSAGNTWGKIAEGTYKGRYVAVIFKGNRYMKKV